MYRLLIDVQYFIGALSALDGVDGPGNHLEVVVNNIKIKDKRAYPAKGPEPRPSNSFEFERNLSDINPRISAAAPPVRNSSDSGSAASSAFNTKKFSMAFGKFNNILRSSEDGNSSGK